MTNPSYQNPRSSVSRIVPTAMGLMFLLSGALLSVLTLASLTNWWSLFILFPGLIFLGTGAILAFTLGGRNPAALWFTGAGLVVSTVAVMFLLGTAEVGRPALRPWVRMRLWLGADVMILGSVFLVNNFSGNAVLDSWHPFRWRGMFIRLSGLGAFNNAANAGRSGFSGRHLVVRSLAAFGLAACAVTLATFLNAEWALQVAAGLASAGLLFIL
ncbi:MAG: hypothetical protein JW929_12950 [Anaerolineales bacterium]|nr:hypothetical protein [Anaerolineales bacterium]